jgi:hypothetical protein
LKKDEVSRTANGQEFRQSLNNPEKNGMEDIDFDASLGADFRLEISDFSICNWRSAIKKVIVFEEWRQPFELSPPPVF